MRMTNSNAAFEKLLTLRLGREKTADTFNAFL
jgi:hypothetical protein